VARARPQGADETHQGLIAGAFKYAGQHSLFGIQKTRWILRIQGLLNLLKLFFQLFNAHAMGKVFTTAPRYGKVSTGQIPLVGLKPRARASSMSLKTLPNHAPAIGFQLLSRRE